MGAWGHKAFENDDALMWVDELLKHPSPQAFLTATFAKSQADVSAINDRQMIAAAETIAKLRGHGAREFPDELIVWMSDDGFIPNATTTRVAIRCVKGIVKDSELLELWGSNKAWISSCRRLMERLERPAKKPISNSKTKVSQKTTGSGEWGSQNEIVKYIRKQNGFVFFENRKPGHAGFDDNCKVSRKLMVAFSNLISLNQVSLTDEPHFNPQWMAPLTALINLEHLSLDGPGIENDHLRFIDQFPKLYYLELQNSNVDDRGLKYLLGCKKLEIIDLTRTPCSQTAVEKLKTQFPNAGIRFRQ